LFKKPASDPSLYLLIWGPLALTWNHDQRCSAKRSSWLSDPWITLCKGIVTSVHCLCILIGPAADWKKCRYFSLAIFFIPHTFEAVPKPGLPDLSWFNVPKRGTFYKITKRPVSLPNSRKILQMTVKCNNISIPRHSRIFPKCFGGY
jgi:hypothetical protein